MSCSYTYKGHAIGNIRQLDDFLLSRKIFESTLGDVVFSKNSTKQLASMNKINIINKDAEDLGKRYAEAKANAQVIDGEEVLKATRPYVGVSEFMSGLRNDQGKLWFPEFTTEYWANQYINWSNGNYTQDEKNVFFNGDESKVYSLELGNQKEWRNLDGSLKDTFGSAEQNKFRQLMEDKWKHQASYGNDIHAILQNYFSKTSTGKYRYELWEESPMQLANSIKYLRKHGLISNSMTDEKINSILTIAKELKEQLQTKYGKNCAFYPEITVSADLNHEYEGRDDLKVLGRLDLLVIDENGIPHIFDYKTSPKSYIDYASAKKLTFTYQQAIYERMLRRYGFNTLGTDINIIPLKLDGFRKEGNDWVYDDVIKGDNILIQDITELANKETVGNNIDEYIEAPLVIDGNAESTIETVTKQMQKCFTNYGKVKTDEEIKALIDKQGGFKVNDQLGTLEFQPKGWTRTISVKNEGNAEAELFKKVKQFITGQKERSLKNTQTIIKALREAQSEDSRTLQLPNNMSDWLKTRLSKYCSSSWEVMNTPAQDIAEQFGIILLYNKTIDVVEVVKISNSDLYYQHSWGQGRTNLLGSKEADLNEDSKSDSLILKAVTGNIELMETMAVLNTMEFNKPLQIANIAVLNPIYGQGTEANSNKELMYNWQKLRQTFDLEGDNKFGDSIKLLSLAEKTNIEYQDIMSRVNDRWQQQNLANFKPAFTQLQGALIPNNTEESINALMDIKAKLEKSFGMSKDIITKGENTGKSIYADYQNYDQQYVKTLYQMVLRSIAELSGLDIRQEVKAHDNWLDSVNILNNGVSGNYIDNAGNFKNRLLNQVTSIALEGYQNARDTIYSRVRKLTAAVEELKRQEGYNVVKEHTFGNQTSLYDGMMEFTADGDLRFVNPWSNDCHLNPAKKEFLKKAILEFNKDSHPDWSQQTVESKIATNDTEFFQVPLLEASFASKVNTDGWLGWLKNKLKMFTSKKNFKEALEQFQTQWLTDKVDQAQSTDGEIFKALNRMDQGHGMDRIQMIENLRKKHGDGFFERDIERLLGAHIMAYSTQQVMESRLPLIKAAYISLAVMGNNQGQDYSSDEKFIKEYVQSKINHLSITDPKLRKIKGALGMLQQGASWMALAFSPLQMTYQSLEGIWKDAKLIITKPDGKETFTLKNMKDSAKIVYKELFNYSDIPSVTEAINAVFGINDMDSISFAQNNSSNTNGFFNFFGRTAYHFASRPDFYNRMTIFVSQMLHDGSYYAHSVDKNGILHYDMKKDERFKALFNSPKNSEAYNKAFSLYLATAQQLVREGATNPDGSLFKVDLDKPNLPKAYSNKESESMKAIGDTMYGYYDNSKKSLMQATMLGGLIMQMKTYWSSKKNQYLAPGGIKAQGKWEQMVSPNGKKCFYSLNDEGKIDKNSMPVEEGDPRASKVPFMQWKGKFEEGVLITLWDIIKRTKKHHGNIKQAWKEKINGNDELSKLYASNIKLLISDMLGYILIGGLISALLKGFADDEIKKARKSKHFEDALSATGANFLYKTVYNSALDMHFFKSIFETSIDWNPFSLSFMSSQVSNAWDMVMGDQSFSKTVCGAFSATRQLRPMFTCLEDQLKED